MAANWMRGGLIYAISMAACINLARTVKYAVKDETAGVLFFGIITGIFLVWLLREIKNEG